MGMIECSEEKCLHNNNSGGCKVESEISVGSSGLAECHTFQENKFDKIRQRLTRGANDIVGIVGGSTSSPCSVTGDPYITAFIKAQSLVVLEEMWRQWVTGYRDFARHAKKEGIDLPINHPAIYWRIKPEIEDSGIAGPNRYSLRARLLISIYG